VAGSALVGSGHGRLADRRAISAMLVHPGRGGPFSACHEASSARVSHPGSARRSHSSSADLVHPSPARAASVATSILSDAPGSAFARPGATLAAMPAETDSATVDLIWTVTWSFISTFAGVLLAAFLSFRIEQRMEERKSHKQAATARKVLIEGLQRNVITMRRMKFIAGGGAGSQSRCPSQRIDRGHLEVSIIAEGTALTDGADVFGRLLNFAFITDHLNRRMDLLEELERLLFVLDPDSPNLVALHESLMLHYEEILSFLNKALEINVDALVQLGAVVPSEQPQS
jgi:hypothetical protein